MLKLNKWRLLDLQCFCPLITNSILFMWSDAFETHCNKQGLFPAWEPTYMQNIFISVKSFHL